MHCKRNAYLLYSSQGDIMAEFCLDCWNKINGTTHPATKYIISEDLDLCEECGQITHVVVKERRFWLGSMIENFSRYRNIRRKKL